MKTEHITRSTNLHSDGCFGLITNKEHWKAVLSVQLPISALELISGVDHQR